MNRYTVLVAQSRQYVHIHGTSKIAVYENRILLFSITMDSPDDDPLPYAEACHRHPASRPTEPDSPLFETIGFIVVDLSAEKYPEHVCETCGGSGWQKRHGLLCPTCKGSGKG